MNKKNSAKLIWEGESLEERGKLRIGIGGIDCGSDEKLRECPYLPENCRGAKNQLTRVILCRFHFEDCYYQLLNY